MEDSPELAAVTRRYLAAFAGGNTTALHDLFSSSDDVSLIGSDPGEWVLGRPVLDMLAAQFAELVGMSITIHELYAWSHGDTGWSMATTTIRMVDGVESPMRWSFFFVLENGHWRIVHNHNSAGVLNEDLLGLTLTLPSLEAVAEAVLQERPELAATAAADGTLTVLFSDIEGSTALAESLGDHAWVTLLADYDRRLREVVDALGGTVVKAMGDGYMCVYPSARLAVRCALRIRDLHPDVLTRVGLHVGDVVRASNDFFGHTVTVAARIAGQAAGGEVLVSDLVRQLVAGTHDFRFAEHGVVELKGIPGIYVLFRADLEPV